MRKDLFTARMLRIFPFKGVLFWGTKMWSLKLTTLILYVSLRDLLFFSYIAFASKNLAFWNVST